MNRRVAVTGAGVVSACGATRADFWQSLREGRPGIRPITRVDTSQLRFHQGAEVIDFDPSIHLGPPAFDLLDRFAQFTMVAAREAVVDSGLDLAPGPATAVITGSSMGGQDSVESAYDAIFRRGGRIHPLSIPRTMANAGASHITMEYGLRGPAFTISSACSSATHAMAVALRMVQRGDVEAALTGGAEAPFTSALLRGWEALRVVAPDTCRPFSRDRRGLILGEGAAMIVIEPLEAARARGARVYAELAGCGMTADAHHITQPSVEGAAMAMRAAVCDAGMAPEDVGYINAHGTGTSLNDATEARAIHDVFGAHADRIAVSSTKSMHGHALGAAGALEAVATVLALYDGILPPTANFTDPDPACRLDVVPNQARPVRVDGALSNSFAFGGLNAVLAFRAVPWAF